MSYMPRSSLRRTACDRCRTQKLKCLRDDGQPKCIRCTRLNVACEVGRPGRPGRPRKPDLAAAAAAAASTFSSSSSPNGAIGSWDAIDQQQDLFLGNELLDSEIGNHGESGDFAIGVGDYDLPMEIEEYPSQAPLQDDSNIDPALTGDQEVADRSQVITSVPPAVNQHECLRELSQLNVELHAQTTMLKENRDSLNLGSFVCVLPHLGGDDDGLTICERCMIYCQRLHRIMAKLVEILKTQSRVVGESRSLFYYDEDTVTPEALNGNCSDLSALVEPPHAPTGTTTTTTTTSSSSSSTPTPTTTPTAITITEDEGGPPALDGPVVLVLVSCYAQVISVHETIFAHIHRRLDSVEAAALPALDPAKGVRLGSFYSTDARLEGAVYCQVVSVLLDRIERGLGVLPDQRHHTGLGAQTGLLSRPHHFELLQRELSGEKGGEEEEEAPNGGRSPRPGMLRDAVERARLVMAVDATWESP